jgi:hypothetical protein
MSGYCSVVIHYHKLHDVWRNHLQTFLLADTMCMRKRMSVVIYEITLRWSTALERFRQRPFKFFSTIWLTPSLVILVENFRCFEPSYWLLHLSDSGNVHCTSYCVRSTSQSYCPTILHFRQTKIWLNQTQHDPIFYTQVQPDAWMKWERSKIRDDSVCMWRTIVLHSIRNRNRTNSL